MTPRPITIDVISDVVCPFCYLGKKNLEEAIRIAGGDVTVRWRPFQLDATIPPQGLDRGEYMRAKFGSGGRLEAIHAQLTETGKQAGIDFRFDAIRCSPNTRDAHRLLAWAGAHGVQDRLADILFRYYFIEGRDVGDRDTLVDAAAEAGLGRDAARTYLDSDEGTAEVEQEIAAAHEMGVTGVPTFILDGRYGVVGAQPPEQLARAITQAREG